MDNNKDPGGNLALWLPGSAVIISIVVSTFALTREPFFEARPAGAQFQVDQPIEARLWQDPFDALERHRKMSKNSESKSSKDSENSTNSNKTFTCATTLFSKQAETSSTKHITITAKVSLATPSNNLSKYSTSKVELSSIKTAETASQHPSIMVALVASGPYADEVESRRRIRYAILAGLKNARMVPEDEQHIHCLTLADDMTDNPPKNKKHLELPYESFVANPLNPPTNTEKNQPITDRIILFWIKEEYLGTEPLQKLEKLKETLSKKIDTLYHPQENSDEYSQSNALKVIGPSTSTVLRDMYREAYSKKAINKKIGSNIEIYSPLASAEEKMLIRGFDQFISNEASSQQKQQEKSTSNNPIKLLRTVSDDSTLSYLILEELKRRRIDPVYGLKCSKEAPAKVGVPCNAWDWRSNRIALVSELDSFYSRAITKTFKENIVKRTGIGKDSFAEINVNDWVLQFSYLRGLDGLLPEESAKARKSPDKTNNQRDNNLLDIGSLENSDGNSQLDYLRRLANHIADQDATYRRNGESGIGAIGVLGTDAYDKLLVLQALKSRMPNKVFFSTDLDARMLQHGHAKIVRNLVLAAPYGLTLTRELQQDVPPFRDSSQSAVFVAVLAALAPQRFEDKLAKFDYANSGLLSPSIYEIGIHGFIPLRSSHADVCQASATVRWRATGNKNEEAPDIMELPCLQDQPAPPYPELSKTARDTLGKYLSIWWAKPLSLILLLLAIFFAWWSTEKTKEEPPISVSTSPSWVHNLPLALHIVAALSALLTVWLWRVEFMWITFLLILLGIICSQLNSHLQQHTSNFGDTFTVTRGQMFDSPAYYTTIPIIVFILMALWVYQQRHSLTEDGLGEPMFLFEGISAWPTLGLRFISVLISISAIAWGWRSLCVNRKEIENSYYLWNCRPSLWQTFPSFIDKGKRKSLCKWLVELGDSLFQIIFPLSPSSITNA